MKKNAILTFTLAATIITSPALVSAQNHQPNDPFHKKNTAVSPADEKMKIGDALPSADVNMKNANGKDVSLNSAMGQDGLLVMFSCNTCPFVIKNQPTTKQVMEYAKAHHIGMVVINSNEAKRGDDDSYNEMQKYAKEQGYTTPYLVDADSKFADMFGANHTPEVFLFDKNKKLVYKGAMNDNPGDPTGAKTMYVNNAIDAMQAGKPINPNSTKSIGCSIKRKA